MRRMSFALTTNQYINRLKGVTRRNGWWNLQPGEELVAVEKAQGVKKGEQQIILGMHRILVTRPEMLWEMRAEDCPLEGFPNLMPDQFIDMYLRHNKAACEKYGRNSVVNRIEFEILWTIADANLTQWQAASLVDQINQAKKNKTCRA